MSTGHRGGGGREAGACAHRYNETRVCELTYIRAEPLFFSSYNSIHRYHRGRRRCLTGTSCESTCRAEIRPRASVMTNQSSGKELSALSDILIQPQSGISSARTTPANMPTEQCSDSITEASVMGGRSERRETTAAGSREASAMTDTTDGTFLQGPLAYLIINYFEDG